MFGRSMRARELRRVLTVGLACGLVIGGLSPAVPALADTQPAAGVPATVSADVLPTWQINGVVWSQVVVNNTVYATGSFTKARPPGVAAGGAGEITANNIFAYDITTGNRVSSFSHSLNAQGRSVAASPDGTKLYVGGDFTTVDGQARGHIAQFDLPGGALNATFKPSLNSGVRALATTGSTVGIGGKEGRDDAGQDEARRDDRHVQAERAGRLVAEAVDHIQRRLDRAATPDRADRAGARRPRLVRRCAWCD